MTAALRHVPSVALVGSRPRGWPRTLPGIERPVVTPVRRRLRARTAAATVLTSGALVLLAALSASGSPAGPPPSRQASVVVQAGDTLWAIAGRVAPERDPRSEVDDLIRLNGLSGAQIVPGQTLRLR